MNRKQVWLLSCALVLALLSALVGWVAHPSAARASATPSSGEPARWIGFYEPGAPQYLGPLNAVEAELGMHVGVTNFFRCIEQGFTAREVANATAHGSIPLITLEFSAEGQSSDVSQPAYSLDSFTAGKHDAVIRAYADAARASGNEIWIRPFHEMNGYWYPWSGTANGNTPSDFIPAWRHVHDIFTREGATNVKFVWCPNVESLPDTSDNSISRYYPGDDYVDYMALDGYNFSTTIPNVHWRSFADLFAKPYSILCSVSATRPIFVAETACVSRGGDKAAWISAMFRSIPQQFPRVVGVDWFNSANERQDWPVDSSPVALQAFRLGVANGSFAPGLTLSAVRSSCSLKTSAKSVKCRRCVKLTGLVAPGQGGDVVRVDVTLPGHRASHRNVAVGSSASWSFKYSPTKRGAYYFTAKFAGDSNRVGSASKAVKVVVK